MIMAALGAVVVFVAVLSYVGQVRAQVGQKRTVLQLTQSVQEDQAITSKMVTPVDVPTKWSSDTMISDLGTLQGQVAASRLPKGAYLQQGSVKPSPQLKRGQREIAIMINAETGVAGKVNPGDFVDIYAAFAASEDHPACAVRVLSGVEVIQVGQKTQQKTVKGGQATTQSVVPITFALPGNTSLNLTYVEANASTVRLARIGGGKDAPAPKKNKVCQIPNIDEASSTDTDTSGGGGNGGNGGNSGHGSHGGGHQGSNA